MTEQEAIEYLNRTYLQFTPLDEYGYVEDFEPYEKAFNMAIKALEKQIPKKPIDMELCLVCPCCENVAIMDSTYCNECGQRLDCEEV